MMEAIAMRLMHAGFPSYVVGEMVTTPVRQEGVFLASAGPGHFPTIETLLKVARDAGGRTIVLTAQPERATQMPAGPPHSFTRTNHDRCAMHTRHTNRK
jgi:D-arabinose 5-phosphate isomerase GutQ